MLAYLTVPMFFFFACRLRSSGTYSLLGELAGALVTAVAQEFDNAALVGGEARRISSLAACHQQFNLLNLQHPIPNLLLLLAFSLPLSQSHSALQLNQRGGKRTPTYPATSLTTSRTKAVRLLRCPLDRETRGLVTRGVVFCIRGKKKQTYVSVHRLPWEERRAGGLASEAEILHEVRLP